MKEIIIYLNKFFDILWIPLSIFPSYIDIIIISAISAVVILFIFKKTSNQEKIKLHKGRITAHILQIRLYKDRPLLTLKSILNILIENILYLRFNIVPLAIIILPIIIVSVQINNRYGYQPVKPGDSFIIQASLDKGNISDPEEFLKDIELITPPAIQIETFPVKIIDAGKIFWRGRVINTGNSEYTLKFSIGGDKEIVKKSLFETSPANGFSPEKSKFGINHLILNNAEGFLPSSSLFKTISINYSRAAYSLLVWKVDIIVLFFVFTLFFALIFKPFLKVTI